MKHLEKVREICKLFYHKVNEFTTPQLTIYTISMLLAETESSLSSDLTVCSYEISVKYFLLYIPIMAGSYTSSHWPL